MRKFGNPSNNIAGSPGLSKRRGGGLSDAGGATDGDYVSEMKQLGHLLLRFGLSLLIALQRTKQSSKRLKSSQVIHV